MISPTARLGRVATVALPFLALVFAWQIASLLLPPYIAPPVAAVLGRAFAILVHWPTLAEVLATVARTLGGLIGAFLLGAALAAAMGRAAPVARAVTPLLTFIQGIPGLSWVVFAVIWFRGTETRIFFIMVLTALPAFTFQMFDAYRGLSRDLVEMVLAFRPRRARMLRVLILPAMLPEILTAWKINLGNASRVIVLAELVGATSGVGYELMQQQQLFDMAGAIAWTLQLVLFVLVVQGLIALIERFALRYRAVSERGA